MEFLYHSFDCYVRKSKQANILPLLSRFEFDYLIRFHKIIYNIIPTALPSYVEPFDGSSRQRSTRLDELSYVSQVVPKISTTHLLDK